MHKNVRILTISKVLANIVKLYFPGKFIAYNSVLPSMLFGTPASEVTKSDLPQQEVQILSF